MHRVRSHPPTGPKGPHFGTQGPTFRVQSVKVKDDYVGDMFSLWESHKQEINLFIEQAISFHLAIKFMAEISENETRYHVIASCKGERLKNESILDIRPHYKPTETLRTFHLRSQKSEVSSPNRQFALIQTEKSLQRNLAFYHNIPTISALQHTDTD